MSLGGEMSEEIQGFPVPPGCEEFSQRDGAWWFTLWKSFERGTYTFSVSLKYPQYIEKPIIKVIQSCGYRAWMDDFHEAFRLRAELESSTCFEWEMLTQRMDRASDNAERCRGWRGWIENK